MKFTILERLMLHVVLNTETFKSDLVGLKLKRKLEDDLSFTQEEIDKYSLNVTEKGNTTWNSSFSNEEKEIQVPEYLNEEIKKRLLKMDKDKVLIEDFVSLYEKFVEII